MFSKRLFLPVMKIGCYSQSDIKMIRAYGEYCQDYFAPFHYSVPPINDVDGGTRLVATLSIDNIVLHTELDYVRVDGEVLQGEDFLFLSSHC